MLYAGVCFLNRIFNVVLRGLTLLSKFVLVFFLAKFLEPGLLGLYGLLAAAIGYSLYVLGFDFYNFSTREIIGSSSTEWLRIVRDQSVFYLIMYLFFVPVVLTVFYMGLLPWGFFVWFLVLLFLEHFAQEMNRILVAMSEQLFAGMVLFLRSGIWCLAVVLFMWIDKDLRQLDFILGGWTLGAASACILSLLKLWGLDRVALSSQIDWRWMRRGVKVAAPLLVASLAVRGVFTFDRYWVEYVTNLEVLGAYVLFISMAVAVLSFLDAGVVVFFYPKLVAAAKAKEFSIFRQVMRSFSVNIIVVTAFLVICCWVVANPLLVWVGNDIYIQYLYLLHWLLLAITFYSLSMIPHVALYAFDKDKAITYSQVAALVSFLIVAYLYSDAYGAQAIAWAICTAFGIMLVWKAWVCRSLPTFNSAEQGVSNEMR